MQYPQRFFLMEDTVPKDEIDKLFEQLEPVIPPPSLIRQILDSVSHLPRPPFPPPPPAKQENEENTLDSLIARNEKLPPN